MDDCLEDLSLLASLFRTEPLSWSTHSETCYVVRPLSSAGVLKAVYRYLLFSEFPNIASECEVFGRCVVEKNASVELKNEDRWLRCRWKYLRINLLGKAA